ncbi:uncharacterized protein SCODWIG_02461 [Saccharomycodes ludwigii]|uniref:Uncharacterized protein n=1 Tax=Saccharomycodes ludwigii TaxID=36035 RepID=A0A376B996_9ASCO|nr:hypothetical protein SCDLUD_002426 [Saccharomycodes ludwigii]KAH3900964.1 hypothetical protein SCDLUD_002426 [Saccharomycodes ludwigii]SSD60700.1 uncharacterized protein SCODWIG_02461 [Saccharomycodes ludwigii]
MSNFNSVLNYNITSPTYIISNLLLEFILKQGATNIVVEVDIQTSGYNYLKIVTNGNSYDKKLRYTLFQTKKFYQKVAAISKNLEICVKTPDEVIGEKWKIDKEGFMIENSLKRITSNTGVSILIEQDHDDKGEFTTASTIRNIKKTKKIINLNLLLMIAKFSLCYNKKVRLQLYSIMLTNKRNITTQSKFLQFSIPSNLERKRCFQNILWNLSRNNSIRLRWKNELSSQLKVLKINGLLIIETHFNELYKLIDQIVNQIYKNLKLTLPQCWFIEINLNDAGLLNHYEKYKELMTQQEAIANILFDGIINYYAANVEMCQDSDGKMFLILENITIAENHHIKKRRLCINDKNIMRKQLLEKSGKKAALDLNLVPEPIASLDTPCMDFDPKNFSYKLHYASELNWIFRKGIPSISIAGFIQNKIESLYKNEYFDEDELKFQICEEGWNIAYI